ncbi:MAG: hypothetical protein IJ438_12015 [Clostridia bacterium]|nr:hypothetical protein [Clostridia bacterium]
MFGLIVSEPSRSAALRKSLCARLHDFDLPLTAFTDTPAPLFLPVMTRASFLRKASAALLQPGQPLPAEALMAFLGDGPLVGNVLRRYLFLQLSLLPYLRPGREVTPLEGFFLLGEDMLVVPVSQEDTVDVQLPPGVWTELNGACHEGRLREMRGYNEMPVLARENALIPIGVNDRSTSHDDADQVTLHWFQPAGAAQCTLADGTQYCAMLSGGRAVIKTKADKPYHLIVHRDGMEHLI